MLAEHIRCLHTVSWRLLSKYGVCIRLADGVELDDLTNIWRSRYEWDIVSACNPVSPHCCSQFWRVQLSFDKKGRCGKDNLPLWLEHNYSGCPEQQEKLVRFQEYTRGNQTMLRCQVEFERVIKPEIHRVRNRTRSRMHFTTGWSDRMM